MGGFLIPPVPPPMDGLKVRALLMLFVLRVLPVLLLLRVRTVFPVALPIALLLDVLRNTLF
jgi:hypothetical protein